ncbi:ornithine cyclodeaminase family protein [Jiangella asiatica]|uniref:Ornithine cyclodeaminase family protein n=1 Tax=Jiangella asiatica TaxID=2530372 RepID=A0A4R5DPA4_9ACTN|nr:ornithine cyclodeaminase family protein [Jiangella asiatica]TDE13994.1 ornithine cyclodeaminase family protein [Jiangella asiatica]
MPDTVASTRHLDPPAVRAGLSMGEAVDALGPALAAATRGEIDQPPRLVLDDGRVLVMAATHGGTGDTVVKTVSVTLEHGGAAPAIVGIVLWLDGATGHAAFTADGAEVTALRTGAVSGLATSLLAAADAHRLTVLGSGRQAAAQVEAMLAVRPIDDVTVFSRTPAHAVDFAARLLRRAPQLTVRTADDADTAVASADIVCCATSSREPLFRTSSLPATVHVNAVGSFRADMSELPPDLLAAASAVVVDDVAGCLAESGEVAAALRDGLDAAALRPLGELAAAGSPAGVPRRTGRTVFKSVGCAVLDWAIAARLAARTPAPLS